MKNEEVDLLLKSGFGILGDAWFKGSWTIRFEDDKIEAFDSPNKSKRYYFGKREALEAILEEIG
ncbi:MAG: hypothetical protein PQJ44_01335 [Sphaerochaetaceae bacterium]|nr:hypothetical protein [Sphaerochaetaceae bacterium]